MFASAEIAGGTAPGVSSGQAIATMEALAAKELPATMSFEWTELTLQQILAGNTAVFVFVLGAVLVFMVLSAQYESWSLPGAIILIVPMCLLAAISGVWLVGSDNNIFTQVGLVVLIGLAAKNAILIVEFAKQLQDQGKSRFDAIIEATKTRLRPILMTSFAFILGVLPLVRTAGAGAEMRFALGIAVFSGMLAGLLRGDPWLDRPASGTATRPRDADDGRTRAPSAARRRVLRLRCAFRPGQSVSSRAGMGTW